MKELIRQVNTLASDVEKLKSLQDSGGTGGGVTAVSVTSPIVDTGTATHPNIGLGITPVTSVGATAPLSSSGGTSPVLTMSVNTTDDGGALAKQGTTPGTAQTGNAHITGTFIADTELSSPLVVVSTGVQGTSNTYPNVGNTVLSAKMGNVYLADGKDVLPDNDQYGLWDRLVNYGYVPDEHFGQGADELAWTGYAAYTGFVTPVFQIYGKSMLQLAHNAAASSFRYRAASTGANIFLRCRVGITYVVSAGLMIDDGVNNADGNGANNFYRVYLTQGALAGAWTAVEQYRTGGGAVTTNVGPTMPYGPFAGIQLTASGTRWTSWTGAPSTFGENGQSVQFTGGSVAFSWTPARVGLYAKFTAVDGGRRAIFDWYDEATS